MTPEKLKHSSNAGFIMKNQIYVSHVSTDGNPASSRETERTNGRISSGGNGERFQRQSEEKWRHRIASPDSSAVIKKAVMSFGILREL